MAICRNRYAFTNSADEPKKVFHVVSCPRCGRYLISEPALLNFGKTILSSRQRANISGWLSENTDSEITEGNYERLIKMPTPSFHERADKLLIAFEKNTVYAGQSVTKANSWKSYGWCINVDELDELLKFLETTGRIEELRNFSTSVIKILPEGWAHLETLKQITNTESNQCFVAMWFSDDMKIVYDNAIAQAIINAGYKPHRVDQREHNQKIDDEIIAQIRRSRFILADFTGHRGGVYFEAGFATGLNREVIWTCREDELKDLHFDIRQYNCIAWTPDNLPDLKQRITNRIEAVFGHGPYKEKDKE